MARTRDGKAVWYVQEDVDMGTQGTWNTFITSKQSFWVCEVVNRQSRMLHTPCSRLLKSLQIRTPPHTKLDCSRGERRKIPGSQKPPSRGRFTRLGRFLIGSSSDYFAAWLKLAHPFLDHQPKPANSLERNIIFASTAIRLVYPLPQPALPPGLARVPAAATRPRRPPLPSAPFRGFRGSWLCVECSMGSKLQGFWNHPAGPKTIHFWAPTFKWALSIANIADFAKPPEKISYPQQLALAATGIIWSRYSTVITPKNWNLFTVNVAMGSTALYQLYRKINQDYLTDGKTAVADSKE